MPRFLVVCGRFEFSFADYAKVGKNLIKNLSNRILNTFETTYQILGAILIFNLHNLVFRTVAQEQHWPLQYKIEMKKLEHTICKMF